MKKTCLALVASLAFSLAATAQVGLGLEAGANLAYLSTSLNGRSSVSGTETGLHLGAQLDLNPAGKFSVVPGLAINRYGGLRTSGPTETELSLNYLSLPVMATLRCSRVDFFAGPALHFLTSSRQEVGSTETPQDQRPQEVDLAAMAGVAYRASSGFYLKSAYNYGFFNVYGEPSGSTDKVRNRAFTLSLGYQFSFAARKNQ